MVPDVPMRTDVYEALRAINVPEADARRAADALEDRLTVVARDLAVLKWMVGTNIILTIALLASMGAMYLKLADLALQVGTLAGRLAS